MKSIERLIFSLVWLGQVILPANIWANDDTHVAQYVENMIVTSTREEKPESQLAESVGTLLSDDLNNIAPTHPAEALNRIPGVHINNLGGEGHMSSIRQPITTSGVYLFLEDGIPTRPTGFFNHNGLYEINIPQSGRVEVIKGPGSALYGSDAIGGVINVITQPSPKSLEYKINGEVGSDRWLRSLLSVGNSLGDFLGKESGFKIHYNHTDNDGFRDKGDYTRDSLGARFDSQLNNQWKMKVIASYSDIDQSGVSSLEYDDYRNHMTKNFYHSDIGFRQVEALRLSAEFQWEIDGQRLLSFTPFYRDNSMKMMPSWMVTYDPNIRDYTFQSYGALIKYRYKLDNGRGELITGIDLDSTPSEYLENRITTTANTDGIYESYTIEDRDDPNYRFDATQTTYSPYIHGEYQLADAWRVNIGVRYDKFEVDYDTLIDPVSSGSHIIPESQKISYEETSPKLGLIYTFYPQREGSQHNAYLSYKYAFRAPTVGALFRPGSSAGSTELQPVTSRSAELGLRGRFAGLFSYELAIYDMTVEDDIVSIIDDTTRKSVNAGETTHQGVEIGFDVYLHQSLQLGFSHTSTRQEYVDFSYVSFDRSCFCSRQINFAGNDVSKAPSHMTNMRLAYTPRNVTWLRTELEWSSVGDYYTDQTNTQKYAGHKLLNLRTQFDISDSMQFYINALNLTDKRYSTYTSNQVGDPDLSYRPGRPRSIFAGFRLTL